MPYLRAETTLAPLRDANDVPSPTAISTATDTVAAAARRLTADERSHRVGAWRQTMQEAYAKCPRRIFDWCAGRSRQQVTTIQRADGTVTGNIEEMDDTLRAAWAPIFQRYSDKVPEPAWEPFADRFAKYYQRHPLHLPRITGADLSRTLARMSAGQAGGMEGWRVRELKRLPPPLLQLLADFYDTVELTGVWPDALEKALITMIQKGQGWQPLSLRPISVCSAVYRLWAGTRVREIMVWQERWMPKGMRGFRLGCAADDVFWSLGLRVERAILTGECLVSLSADLTKCFDSLPHGIMLRLLQELGMDDRILRPLRRMYARLRRRFRVGAGAVGEEFICTQGLLQGCPLSVAALSAIASGWCRAVEEETGAHVDSYADDGDATAIKPTAIEAAAAVQKGADVTEEYCDLTGQMVSIKKTSIRCTDPAATVAVTYKGTQLQRLHDDRVLGAHVCFSSHRRPPAAPPRAAAAPAPAALAPTTAPTAPFVRARLFRAADFVRRARWLPIAASRTANILAAGPVSSALFGGEVTRFNPKHLHDLRVRVAETLMPRHRRRCNEILLTLFHQGHRVDPVQALPYRVLCSLRRQMSRWPEIRAEVGRLWALRCAEPNAGEGPLRRVLETCSSVGWKWTAPEEVTDDAGRTISFLDIECGAWEHAIRDAIRLQQWRAGQERRAKTGSNDLDGVQSGIDRAATLAMHNHRATTPIDKGFLRVIICNGCWTYKRLSEAHPTEFPTGHCRFCSDPTATENIFHTYWLCPAWEALRIRHPLRRVRAAIQAGRLPNCITHCGIIPADIDAIPLLDPDHPADRCAPHRRRRPAEPTCSPTDAATPPGRVSSEQLGPARPYDDSCRDAQGEAWHEGYVIVFGDGGCEDNESRVHSRAGVGVYWGPAHRFNAGIPLSGPIQSNNAAEIEALIYTLETDDRPVEFRTDSRHVHDGVTTHRSRWRANDWRPRLRATAEIPNHRRWRRLDQLLHRRTQATFRIAWVKAHTSWRQVVAGDVTPFNHDGNNHADALATAGIACHRVPRHRVAAVTARVHLALAIQRMMLSIAHARADARRRLGDGPGGDDDDDGADETPPPHPDPAAAAAVDAAVARATGAGRRDQPPAQRTATTTTRQGHQRDVVDAREDLYPWGWSPPPPHRVAEPVFHCKSKVTSMYTKPRVRRSTAPDARWYIPAKHPDEVPPQLRRQDDHVWFPYGATFYKALVWWLGRLRWPTASPQRHGAHTAGHTASDGITYAELALDLEAATGIDIPPPQSALVAAGHHEFAPPQQGHHKTICSYKHSPLHRWWDAWVQAGVSGADRPHVPRNLQHRAETLWNAWRLLQELCSAPLAPGEHRHAHNIRRHHSTHVEGLRALGATDVSSGGGHRWAGWSLRPAFVGGTRTETILRSLPAQSMMWR